MVTLTVYPRTLSTKGSYTHRSEGIWIVQSRGIVAIILIVLILGLALNSLIIDPIRETDEVLVKTSMSPGIPTLQLTPSDMNVIVVRPNITRYNIGCDPNSCRG
jgi:hypothetical protein